MFRKLKALFTSKKNNAEPLPIYRPTRIPPVVKKNTASVNKNVTAVEPAYPETSPTPPVPVSDEVTISEPPTEKVPLTDAAQIAQVDGTTSEENVAAEKAVEAASPEPATVAEPTSQVEAASASASPAPDQESSEPKDSAQAAEEIKTDAGENHPPIAEVSEASPAPDSISVGETIPPIPEARIESETGETSSTEGSNGPEQAAANANVEGAASEDSKSESPAPSDLAPPPPIQDFLTPLPRAPIPPNDPKPNMLSPTPDGLTPDQICGITPNMTLEQIRQRLAILYRRYNFASSSLNAGLRAESETALNAIVAVREKYFGPV